VIERGDVPQLVLAACPSFEEPWRTVEAENLYDGERLYYLDAGDFIRHLVDLRLRGRTEEFDSVFRMIEQLVVDGDGYVSNLGVIGYLEGLQMATVTSAGIDPEEEFRPRLGPVSSRWWERINRFWAGDATALQVDEP